MTYSIHVLSKLCVESVAGQFCARARAQDILFPHERDSRALRDLNTSRHGEIVNYHSYYHRFGAGIAYPVWWLVLGLDDLKSSGWPGG